MTPDFRLTSPVATIAAVPYLLGYEPQHSLVVINLDAQSVASTMRVDLPWQPGDDVVAQTLVEWAQALSTSYAHMAGDGVMLIVYPADGGSRARQLLLALRDSYETFVEVRDALIVTLRGRDTMWASALCGNERCCPPEGTVLDELEADRVRSFFILHGRAPAHRRAELIAEVAASPDKRSRRIRRKLATYERLTVDAGKGGDALADRESWRDDAIDFIGAVLGVGAALTAADELPDEAVVRLLAAMRDTRVRDTVMWELAQAPREHDWERVATLLADIVRVAPEGYVAPIATTLAQVRWGLGDGARASMALDRALEEDSRYTMAGLLRHAIGSGIPPSSWLATLRAAHRNEFRRPGDSLPRAS